MKCFFCQSTVNVSDKVCPTCSKVLIKVCPTCDILYDDNSKFCSSCGGRLAERKEVKPASSEKRYCAKCRKVYETTANFCTNCGGSLEKYIEKPEPELKLESKSDEIELESFSTESEVVNEPLKMVEIEEPEEAEVVDSSAKPQESFDDLLMMADELLDDFVSSPSLNSVKTPLEKEEKKAVFTLDDDMEIASELVDEELPELEQENIEEFEVDDFSDIENVDEIPEIDETMDEGLESLDVMLANPDTHLEKGTLNPLPLVDYIQKQSRFPGLSPFFSNLIERLSQNRGGLYFIKGDEGLGKSFFAADLAKHIDGSEDKTFKVFSDKAVPINFDYSIFFNLFSELMNIKDDSAAEMSLKVDAEFANVLPEEKLSHIKALLAMNFIPFTGKLPKHDIEYFISYMLFHFAAVKPFIWIIDNTSYLNLRTVKLFKRLISMLENSPIAIVFLADRTGKILELEESSPTPAIDLPLPDISSISKAAASYLGVKVLSAQLEMILENASGNLLMACQMLETLKDSGYIFRMKKEWRFSLISEDFKFESSVEKMLLYRFSRLDKESYTLLKNIVLLNLYEIPVKFLKIIFKEEYIKELFVRLEMKGYIRVKEDKIEFNSPSILNILRREIKISNEERLFYKKVVTRLSETTENIYPLNRNWLIQSYINLAGLVDKRFNSFLFTSAVYMEKLGFFELAQRSYQTIISSFSDVLDHDDFRIMLQMKNSRLWRFIDSQWSAMFWKKLLEISEEKKMPVMTLTAECELLFLHDKEIDNNEMIKKFDSFDKWGSYGNKLIFADRYIEYLMEKKQYQEAFELASSCYLSSKKHFESFKDRFDTDSIISHLFIKFVARMAELLVELKRYEEAMVYVKETEMVANLFSSWYFLSRASFILARIKSEKGEDGLEDLRNGFDIAVVNMLFPMIKKYFIFFEENNLEETSWLKPFMHYKIWLSVR